MVQTSRTLLVFLYAKLREIPVEDVDPVALDEQTIAHAVNEAKQRYYSRGFNDCFNDAHMVTYAKDKNDSRKNKHG